MTAALPPALTAATIANTVAMAAAATTPAVNPSSSATSDPSTTCPSARMLSARRVTRTTPDQPALDMSTARPMATAGPEILHRRANSPGRSSPMIASTATPAHWTAPMVLKTSPNLRGFGTPGTGTGWVPARWSASMVVAARVPSAASWWTTDKKARSGSWAKNAGLKTRSSSSTPPRVSGAAV